MPGSAHSDQHGAVSSWFRKAFSNWLWNSGLSFCWLLSWRDHHNHTIKTDHPHSWNGFDQWSVNSKVNTDPVRTEFPNVWWARVCVSGMSRSSLVCAHLTAGCVCGLHKSGTFRLNLVTRPPRACQESTLWVSPESWKSVFSLSETTLTFKVTCRF